MAAEGLGFRFDLAVGLVPYDTNAGAGTGKRFHMSRAANVTAVLYKGVGVGTDNPVITLQQHTASSGGTTSSLAVIDHYYQKTGAATLTGSETWTRYAQSAAATITDPGGVVSATKEIIVAIPVNGTALSDGYAWISVNIADTGAAGAQLGCVLYIASDLVVQRSAANLANTLTA